MQEEFNVKRQWIINYSNAQYEIRTLFFLYRRTAELFWLVFFPRWYKTNNYAAYKRGYWIRSIELRTGYIQMKSAIWHSIATLKIDWRFRKGGGGIIHIVIVIAIKFSKHIFIVETYCLNIFIVDILNLWIEFS